MSNIFRNQSSSDEDESQINIFSQLYGSEQSQNGKNGKLYLPEYDQISFNQQVIELGELTISLIRLKQKSTQSQIKKMHLDLKIAVNYKKWDLFKNFPSFGIQAVDQYRGKQYQLRINNPDLLRPPLIISHIRFPNLQILNLNDLQIQNIQSLSWISAPSLRCIELYNNQITNIKILNKANFTKLQVITFYNNPISEMDNFERIHCKKLTGYELDDGSGNKNRVEDYRFFFKMQNPQLKMLKIQDPQRIEIKKKPFFSIINQPGTTIVCHQPRIMRARRRMD